MILRAIEFLSYEPGVDECNLSNIQISNLTGIACNHVGAQLASLAKLKIINLGKGHCRMIKFNPNLDEWQLKKGKVSALAKAVPKSKAAICNKSLPVAKPKSRSAKNVTPEWFKHLWRTYPARLRGGNHAAGWKKWQSSGLTEDDANKATKWLVAAAAVDPDWGVDSRGGYILGWIKFIGDTRWRAPVPTRQAMSGRTKKVTDFDSGNPVDYTTGVKEWNEEADAWAAENKRVEARYQERIKNGTRNEAI